MMDDIFARMDSMKKVEYSRKYAEELYLKYMNANESREYNYENFKQLTAGKTILLIGPGKSSITERDSIIDYASKDDIITISVNFRYPHYEPDFIFVSNNYVLKNYPRATSADA